MRARSRKVLKVTCCPAPTLTVRADEAQHADARGMTRLTGPALRVPCTPAPDTAAKPPGEKLPSTFTTVADTSAATRSDWVHLDVALRRMSSAARHRDGRSRSESACRGRDARTGDLARELEERRAASRSTASPSVVA